MKDQVKLVGILNCTPDSFSDGGKFNNTEAALTQAESLFLEGAHWVDVGGQSTRPGARELEWEEEWGRLNNIMPLLLEKYFGKISLDTKTPEVAQRFCELGGNIINDVSGFQNPRMVECAAQFQTQVVVNHFPGKTIAEVHEKKIDSVNQIVDELMLQKQVLLQAGILPENIILDPGIGFGKTMGCNWDLLKFASKLPEESILIGFSRKRFLGERRFEKAINLEAAQVAIEAGAEYLRVHEVGGVLNCRGE